MILRALQIITFLVTATIEVKVHAREVVSLSLDATPIEEPAKCLESGEVCAVKTSLGKKLVLDFDKSWVTLGSTTSIIRSHKNQINFVAGSLMVKSDDVFTIETEFGKVIVKSGEAILLKEQKKLIARVNSGEVFLQPRGKNEMFQIEPGLENSLSSVDETGVAHTEISKAVNLPEHALLWSSLYTGGKKSFEKDFKAFARTWQKANERAVAVHSDLAKRRVASLEDQYQKQQAALKKRHAYEAQLRSLFRRKSLDQ